MVSRSHPRLDRRLQCRQPFASALEDLAAVAGEEVRTAVICQRDARAHCRAAFQSSYDKTIAYAANPQSASVDPNRSSKRSYGSVFSSAHMEKPLHGGMRPSTPPQALKRSMMKNMMALSTFPITM
jgi:hypothetical protein